MNTSVRKLVIEIEHLKESINSTTDKDTFFFLQDVLIKRQTELEELVQNISVFRKGLGRTFKD